jgi:hypothetical protein
VLSLDKTMFDEPVEKAYQRDRLQFEHVGEIDLGQALLVAQSKQDNPLCARCAAALGAVIDIVAQKPRTFDELSN